MEMRKNTNQYLWTCTNSSRKTIWRQLLCQFQKPKLRRHESIGSSFKPQQACDGKLHCVLACPFTSKHLSRRHREAYIEGRGQDLVHPDHILQSMNHGNGFLHIQWLSTATCVVVSSYCQIPLTSSAMGSGYSLMPDIPPMYRVSVSNLQVMDRLSHDAG
jgi:hypothetical protein